MTRLRVGVIGAGTISQVEHIPNLLRLGDLFELVGVADPSPGSRSFVADTYGVAAFSRPEELLDRPLDAVVIGSPDPLHHEQALAALARDLHVFCEKPIDLTLARIDQALAAVEAAKVELQIGFNRRFDANHVRVRQAIVSGEIGEPHLLHIISRDPAPPPIAYIQVSGGIFLDMTIHDFDMARFLMGCEATEVYAVAAVRVDPAIGAAGDIGHVPIADAGNVLCSCGQTGCLEAVAGAAAVARSLTDLGVKTTSSRDVGKHLRAGRPEAIKLVREAGRRLGQALSMVVAIVNPGLIVVGGTVRDFAGLEMKGGTIVLRGGAELRTGAWMHRGTIISLKSIPLLPSFLHSSSYVPTFMGVLSKHLGSLGIRLPLDVADGSYQRFLGDTSVKGKGEILIWHAHAAASA